MLYKVRSFTVYPLPSTAAFEQDERERKVRHRTKEEDERERERERVTRDQNFMQYHLLPLHFQFNPITISFNNGTERNKNGVREN